MMSTGQLYVNITFWGNTGIPHRNAQDFSNTKTSNYSENNPKYMYKSTPFPGIHNKIPITAVATVCVR